MKIVIQSKPYKKMRYPTVGDWRPRGKDLTVDVAELPDWRMEALIAIHELVEAFICRQQGIKEPDVTAFDKQYEKERKQGDVSEPGDSPDAPYRQAHRVATMVEKILAKYLKVSWKEYEKYLEKL